MSTQESDSNIGITLPLWQVILVLVGLPAIYMVNSAMPWSIGLLRRHNHAFFLQFWTSIALLHWSSAALVIFLLKRAGGRLRNIGVNLSPLRIAAMIGIPVIAGLVFIALRKVSAVDHGPLLKPAAVVSPATMREQFFWIFMCITAGFCEELIYRGFSIRILQWHKMRTWLAVGLATLAFVLMHGITVLSLFPFVTIYIAGLIFSAIFLWRRSLVLGICLHALFDLAAIASP